MSDDKSKKQSFHWLRAGKETKLMSFRLPLEDRNWLYEQAQLEGITVTELVNRALQSELDRIEALGPNPSKDDLDYGRI